MRIAEALRERRPFFSFEFFPPKSDAGVETLLATIETLRELAPAYVSVTYGAGGSNRARTLATAKRIKNELGLEVLAHLTCVGSSRDELRAIVRDLQDGGIENVLALRGDPPRGETSFTPAADGFAHASDLVAMLAHETDLCLGAAAYPETHPEAPDPYTDLLNTARKVDAGASFLVTQLFFDNDAYFAFVKRARDAGIAVPIVPGIMPITNYDSLATMTKMCGATIPSALQRELDRRRDEPNAVAELGVAFATLQCNDLLARGAPGIHFYTLNKSPATRAIGAALAASLRVSATTP